MKSSKRMQYLSIGQGGVYLLTSLWPLASMRSFQRVTGRKTDLWLVRTVALLLVVIGTVPAVSGFRRRTRTESALLGAGSAAALVGIDIYYAVFGRISRVYLLDALVELAFVIFWARAYQERPAEGEQTS